VTPPDSEGTPNAGGNDDARGASAISVEEVKRLLERGQPITFIDARNPISWGSSKVKLPGAVRVPLDDVDRLLPHLPRDRRLIVYCT